MGIKEKHTVRPEQLPVICGVARRRLAAGRPLGSLLTETIERAIEDNRTRAELPELRELLTLWATHIYKAG